ncbi:MAG: DUF3034 family protein [Candidatus Omnitrophica bacterium]|nr:DUF3034 family protein [Candidatus Omnitrophota bacterium]
MKSKIQIIIAGLFVLVSAVAAQAGVPLNNVEGVGGVAFNPLAYTAGTPFDSTEKAPGASTAIKDLVNKPQFGIWRIRLNDVHADWTTQSVATTFFDRLEVSYGNETIAQSGAKNIHKNDIGLKGLLVKENAGDTKWVPAVAVGAIYKDTSFATSGDVKDHGYDYYAVVTKLIPQLPRPVLLSGGIRSTDSRSTGVYGFGTQRKLAGFGNVDVILPGNVAVGFEYEQGAQVKGWKNADYYDAHVAWLSNKNLTLVAAYVNTGSSTSASRVGLGDGFVLSAHYAF